ncbi:ATBF1 [Mytilus coruscus]|uniref:ATBF1 n=1 Tax=Mytilus coruscus TaxID=42192 RepID=A0A6J8BKD0_MYTCO|nr:ATBF1 [Mytilus coruscus]
MIRECQQCFLATGHLNLLKENTYKCEVCTYGTDKKSNFVRHLTSSRHRHLETDAGSTKNENLKKALERQHVLQTHELTFLNRVADLLYMYNLPPWTYLKDQLPSKLSWKCKAREAINNYWKGNLQRDANSKTTLKFLCIPYLDIEKPHTIWNSLPPNIGELRKATIKARLCTGTYISITESSFLKY